MKKPKMPSLSYKDSVHMKMSKKLLIPDHPELEEENSETTDLETELDLWLSIPMKMLNLYKPSEMFQELKSLMLTDLILDN